MVHLEMRLGRGETRARWTLGVMTVVSIVVGAILVAWILNDIFKAVLVPRAIDAPFRISVIGSRILWRAWRSIGASMKPGSRREDFLGSYAPLAFVVLILLWLLGLIFGYGLILYGLQDQLRPASNGFSTALYFAATSVLTIGYGDVVAAEGPARIVALAAGASGLGTVAITIAFLYALVGAFQQRERFVVFLDARAGAPPSGLALLETYATLGILDQLPELFRASEFWVADVLGSHLAYPLMMFFRSDHKDESWVAALGALLDAAALLVSVIEGEPTGPARLFLDSGVHLTHDLADYFDLPSVENGMTSGEARTALCARLAAAGYRVKGDDASWLRFSALRESYARTLGGIGVRWLVATAMLVGERTSLPGHTA
jgi:hypothetical protein